MMHQYALPVGLDIPAPRRRGNRSGPYLLGGGGELLVLL